MRQVIIIAAWLLAWAVTTTWALDKNLTTTIPAIMYGLFDTEGNGGNGITGLGTGYTKYVLKLKCREDAAITITTATTPTEIGGGYYEILPSNTVAVVTNYDWEDECIHWAEGAAEYAGLIRMTPEKFKAIRQRGDTASVTAVCDISASTSGSSFTLAACTDADGNAITLVDDKFNGLGLIATTNGGATCNVNGEAILVEDTTTAGVITAKTDAPFNSGFKAAPSATNCGAQLGL